MSENTSTAKPKSAPTSRAMRRATKFDPDRFQRMAKEAVIANFNEHRDEEKSPELTIDGVYIVWFAKVLGNWKAIIASPLARGLLWEVSFSGSKNEIYLDVYTKLNNVKISLTGCMGPRFFG